MYYTFNVVGFALPDLTNTKSGCSLVVTSTTPGGFMVLCCFYVFMSGAPGSGSGLKRPRDGAAA